MSRASKKVAQTINFKPSGFWKPTLDIGQNLQEIGLNRAKGKKAMARRSDWGRPLDDAEMDAFIKVKLEIQAQILALIEPLPYDQKQYMLTHCKHIVRIDYVARQRERDEILRQAKLERDARRKARKGNQDALTDDNPPRKR